MSRETDRARQMRKALTPPEARLWAVLKRLRAEGFQFRRQAPLLGYYLDFVCFSRRLIVEVDGAFHEGQRRERDRVRDERLAAEGFTTLRYTNEDVRDNADLMLAQIRVALAEKSPSRPSGPPSP